MRAADVRPWSLFIAKLRDSDHAAVSYAEVSAAGADRAELVRLGLLEYGRTGDGYRPRDCEQDCNPNLDPVSRHREGLIGVACPYEPACWPAWRWEPSTTHESLRCHAASVFSALGRLNGLGTITADVTAPFIPVGQLQRQGLRFAVVWLRDPAAGFELSCQGLRQELRGEGLIVLVGRALPVTLHPRHRIAVLELVDDPRGHLHLERATAIIDPGYRKRAVEEAHFDLDFVHLRFETRPGQRHVVWINGHDFGGFRLSDLKFLRLLLLAAARIKGDNHGWIEKSRLLDHNDKARGLELLRAELADHDVPDLLKSEQRALVKGDPSTGRIRLAVPSENIELDESLSRFAFIAPTLNRRGDGVGASSTEKQQKGLLNAQLMLDDIRNLDVIRAAKR
jgi:hypothetical protein